MHLVYQPPHLPQGHVSSDEDTSSAADSEFANAEALFASDEQATLGIGDTVRCTAMQYLGRTW